MDRAKKTWIIFQSRNGDISHNDGWLDYCREEVPHNEAAETWAECETAYLAKRIGCECRFRVEVW